MTEYYEKKMEFNLTERELIVLANNSLYEVGAQLDRVRGAMDQIEADQENDHLVEVAEDLLLDEVSYEMDKLRRYLIAIKDIGHEKRKAKK
ncbi:hypothetical protein [uncultured Dubosiella sp.]|uniref:hypothetical protein n=1 Tax=uncultured Dubosiella sp. TaxID=1937011 RepID=UPI00260CB703|nr:hypothetical protein [uncultured Dubosiella sp.]